MRECLYRGSVKEIFRVKEGGQASGLLFSFSDRYSIFDWGEMPDLIPFKGNSLCWMAAFFFQAYENPKKWAEFFEKTGFRTHREDLSKKGMKTHCLGVVLDQNGKERSIPLAEIDFQKMDIKNEKASLWVKEFPVVNPATFRVSNRLLYDYSKGLTTAGEKRIPLEVIFRFGVPDGSSLLKRLKKRPELLGEYGLEEIPEPNTWLSQTIIEFSSKLEPMDRVLDLEKAFLISGLNAVEFQELYEKAELCARFLKFQFDSLGVELWDGKFEFAIDDRGEIILIDSIGPDELRLKLNGVHLSKEILRKLYEGTEWHEALLKAKLKSESKGIEDWKSLVLDEYQARPMPLPRQAVEAVSRLYLGLFDALIGAKNEELSLSLLASELKEIMHGGVR